MQQTSRFSDQNMLGSQLDTKATADVIKLHWRISDPVFQRVIEISCLDSEKSPINQKRWADVIECFEKIYELQIRNENCVKYSISSLLFIKDSTDKNAEFYKKILIQHLISVIGNMAVHSEVSRPGASGDSAS